MLSLLTNHMHSAGEKGECAQCHNKKSWARGVCIGCAGHVWLHEGDCFFKYHNIQLWEHEITRALVYKALATYILKPHNRYYIIIIYFSRKQQFGLIIDTSADPKFAPYLPLWADWFGLGAAQDMQPRWGKKARRRRWWEGGKIFAVEFFMAV